MLLTVRLIATTTTADLSKPCALRYMSRECCQLVNALGQGSNCRREREGGFTGDFVRFKLLVVYNFRYEAELFRAGRMLPLAMLRWAFRVMVQVHFRVLLRVLLARIRIELGEHRRACSRRWGVVIRGDFLCSYSLTLGWGWDGKFGNIG